MKYFFAATILLVFTSCKPPEIKNQPNIEQKKEVIKQITAKKDSIIYDTIEFVSYNDNFDYFQLNGKKGKEELSFINDNNNDRSFLRGDIIAIEWKNDTIYIAGDGETPENAEWIVSAKKIKDGNVSKLRKEYGKNIKYTYPKENEISDSYLEHLHVLAEYYIANSKKHLIKLSVKNKENLAYSIEKQTRENKEYYVLGIYTEFEHRINTFQWLYIDPEDDKIYEYDLPNDRLIYFP